MTKTFDPQEKCNLIGKRKNRESIPTMLVNRSEFKRLRGSDIG